MTETVQILLVEDTSTDERFIRELLSEAARVQFHVSSAASLRLATVHVRQQEIDAILVDLTLPDSTGIETFT